MKPTTVRRKLVSKTNGWNDYKLFEEFQRVYSKETNIRPSFRDFTRDQMFDWLCRHLKKPNDFFKYS